MWASGFGSDGKGVKDGIVRAIPGHSMDHFEMMDFIAAADDQHPFVATERHSVAIADRQPSRIFSCGTGPREVERIESIMPDLFAALPWHDAVREIGTAAAQ